MKTEFSQRDVRDPRRLAPALEKNFAIAAARMDGTLGSAITGMLKATSGVVSAATADTDYVTPDNAIKPPAVLPASDEAGVLIIDDKGVVTADNEGITTAAPVVIPMGGDATLTIEVKNGLIVALEYDDGEV